MSARVPEHDIGGSMDTTVAHAFNVELLAPEAAGDTAKISALTNLVNEVYAESEDGL